MKVYHLVYCELYKGEQLISWHSVGIIEDDDYDKIERIMITEMRHLEERGCKIHLNYINSMHDKKILMNGIAIKDDYHFVIKRDFIVS